MFTRVASNHGKLLNVYTFSSENELFLIVFRICLIKQLIPVCDIFPGFCFFVVVVVFSQLNKILLLEIIIERVAPYFSFVPNQ